MSDRLNKIEKSLTRADIILEQVDPTGIEDLLPEEGDTAAELFTKRWKRFVAKPHISRSYAIGGGLNLNNFLPPGISMTGESIDEFNNMVTSWPVRWWQNPMDPMYATYWEMFITGIFIYGIEWSGSDFADLGEWVDYIIEFHGGATGLYDQLINSMGEWLVDQVGWTIDQVDAFLSGAWDGIMSYGKWLTTQAGQFFIDNIVPFFKSEIPGKGKGGGDRPGGTIVAPIGSPYMGPGLRRVYEQTSPMERMKDKAPN